MNAKTSNLGECNDVTDCTHPGICDCSPDESLQNMPNRQSKDTVVNDYGRQLLELCKSSDLTIVNGRIDEDNVGQYTGVGTTGKSVVDYLITATERFDQICEFKVDTDAIESDHRSLCFSINTTSDNHAVYDDEILLSQTELNRQSMF